MKLNQLTSKLTNADKLLIVILIIIAVSFYFFLNHRDNQKVAEIYQNNRIIKKINLNKDHLIKILGDSLIVQVKNGSIRIKKSNCKNQYCVKQGWSSSLPIICVPNKVAIVIKDKKGEDIIITR
mgnify:CR=1 FL=1